MKYILRHWQGELSLAVSFWINFFLLNVAKISFDTWLTQNSPIKHPQIAARVGIIYIAIVLVIVYPWQIIGAWRACNRHVATTGKAFWARAAQVFLIFGFLATLGNLNKSWPIYNDLYDLGFKKDQFANYTLKLENNDTLIHLKGGLGFGVSEDIAEFLKHHPEIKGIILDSIGGRIYEGRELSKLILIHGLDTYSLEGCYSACTTAFIAGENRFLGIGANLAFHQYIMGYKALGDFVDVKKEQQEDLRIFERQRIKPDFVKKLFDTPHDDLWYPTIDEMLNAGVIQGVVNPSDITPVKYEASSKDLDEAFLSVSVFRVIRQYDPEAYQKILEELEELVKKGATQVELQEKVASYIEVLVTRTMSQTSNEAVIRFAQVMIDVLKTLEEKDPILCLKNLYPQQYGTVNNSRYLSNDEMMLLLDAMSRIIIDAYEKKSPSVDTEDAELQMQKVVLHLGEDAKYLELQTLQNSAQYKRHCDVVVKIYNLILNEDKKTAGNALRYVFGQS